MDHWFCFFKFPGHNHAPGNQLLLKPPDFRLPYKESDFFSKICKRPGKAGNAIAMRGVNRFVMASMLTQQLDRVFFREEPECYLKRHYQGKNAALH